MIIKVPIYVEVEGFSGTDLSSHVNLLNKVFTFTLRGKVITRFPGIDSRKLEKELGDFKIITREQAFETLRTKK